MITPDCGSLINSAQTKLLEVWKRGQVVGRTHLFLTVSRRCNISIRLAAPREMPFRQPDWLKTPDAENVLPQLERCAAPPGMSHCQRGTHRAHKRASGSKPNGRSLDERMDAASASSSSKNSRLFRVRGSRAKMRSDGWAKMSCKG
jgi:hypothetical protein